MSAAIIRDGKVLIVRRARKPALNLYSLPGGAVEVGEQLADAVVREVREETALDIEPIALAGHREAIMRDKEGQVERHFVILCFASRWLRGEPVLNSELDVSGNKLYVVYVLELVRLTSPRERRRDAARRAA